MIISHRRVDIDLLPDGRRLVVIDGVDWQAFPSHRAARRAAEALLSARVRPCPRCNFAHTTDADRAECSRREDV